MALESLLALPQALAKLHPTSACHLLSVACNFAACCYSLLQCLKSIDMAAATLGAMKLQLSVSSRKHARLLLQARPAQAAAAAQ